MSSIRSRKELVGNLDTAKKAELVQNLKKEKLKREQELAAARERRLQRQAAGKSQAAQPESRPLADLVNRVRRNDPQLTSLNFSVGVWWLSGTDIENLSEALAANTKVTEVNFHGNSLGPEGTAILADALMHNRSVTSVNLATNKVTDGGMLPLAQALGSEGCTLKSLILLSNNVSDVGALDLFPALATNASLQSLDLSGNGISNIGGTSLAEAMASNTTLTELMLSHNALEMDSVQKIRDVLQENWTLTKLDLNGNSFDQEVKSQIAALIQRNVKLRNLNMLKASNSQELTNLSTTAQRPADGAGKPVRFAYEIDIQQTDPRLLAATQTGKDLVLEAMILEQNRLLDKAEAVVHVAMTGSTRGLLAMSKFVAEGPDAALAVAERNGIPVLVDLIAGEVAAERGPSRRDSGGSSRMGSGSSRRVDGSSRAGGAAQPPQVLRVGSDDDPSHLEEPHASPEEPHESSEEPHECPEEPRENDRSHLEEAAEVGVSNPEEPQPQLEFSPPEDPEEPQESGFSEPDPAAFQNAKRRVCESTEALKHAVVCLLAIAKTGADQAEQIVKYMAIGPLVALLDIDRLQLSRLLATVDVSEASGPLSVVEASWKSVWMATMSAALAALLALAASCPPLAVPAAIAEQSLAKFTQLCSHAEDADQHVLTHELRVNAIEAIAELGRYDVALHRMKEPLEALVQCLGSKDNTIAMSANRALLRLLDQKGLTDLEKLIPPEEEEEEDDVFTAISAWVVEADGLQIAAERLLEARDEEGRVAALLLLGLLGALSASEAKVTKAGGKGIIYCLLQVLLFDRREDCVVNSLWVLGAMLEDRPVLQRTLCQHDAGKLLVRLCGEDNRQPHSQIAGHSAWLLGIMCQDPDVCSEVVKEGAVEKMVEVVTSSPEGSQGRLAGLSLQRMVETSAEGRRRAMLCGAFDAFVLLSQRNTDKEVVASAVSGISCLTHDTIADRLSYREDTGAYEAVDRSKLPQREEDPREREEKQRSIAARYLQVDAGATRAREEAAVVSLLAGEAEKPPVVAEKSNKALPSVEQARRELRAKLLRQRAQR